MASRDPGTASVAEIARHWAVSPPTARRILAAAGLQPVGDGWARHRWADVWRIEGEPYVPPPLWPAFRAPLLTPEAVACSDPRGRSERTLRRLRAAGRLPEIRLAPSVRRVRAVVLDEAASYA